MQEDAIFVSEDSHAESGTAKELAELKAMLRRQDAEVERLRTQLAATEIEKRKDTEIPDLNLAGIEEFLKKERVTVSMKDACAVPKESGKILMRPWRMAGIRGETRVFNSRSETGWPTGYPRTETGSRWMHNPARIAVDARRRETWRICGIGVSGAHCGRDGRTRGGKMPSRESNHRASRGRRTGGWRLSLSRTDVRKNPQHLWVLQFGVGSRLRRLDTRPVCEPPSNQVSFSWVGRHGPQQSICFLGTVFYSHVLFT